MIELFFPLFSTIFNTIITKYLFSLLVQQEDKPDRRLDANAYATKKTIAQGMLDVALLTANASQLKYLLQLGKVHEFYYLMITLISLSLVLQVSKFEYFLREKTVC